MGARAKPGVGAVSLAPGRQTYTPALQSDLCRRHSRPPRPQRSTAQPVRRQPAANPNKINPQELTEPTGRCHKSSASEAPPWAASRRNTGRHQVGMPGRLHRNPHSVAESNRHCECSVRVARSRSTRRFRGLARLSPCSCFNSSRNGSYTNRLNR